MCGLRQSVYSYSKRSWSWWERIHDNLEEMSAKGGKRSPINGPAKEQEGIGWTEEQITLVDQATEKNRTEGEEPISNN